MHDPEHPLDDQAMIGGWSAYPRLLCWQKWTNPLPLDVGESWQAWQTDRLGKQVSHRRRLTSAALHMVLSVLRLMVSTVARPPQPPSALLFWLPQKMKQAAQFRNTQPENCSLWSAFFSCA